MNLSVTLANNLLCLRRKRKLTQEILAEMCHISTQQVSKIENARANICMDILQKLCDGLEVDISDLFCQIP